MTTYTSIWGDPGSSPTTLNSSTSLNSLADDDIANVETGIDNTTNRHKYAAFELYLNADLSSANANPACYLYAFPSFDGTNYVMTANETDETAAGPYLIGTFAYLQDASQTYSMIENAVIGPWKYKFALFNDTGAAFPASGVTLKVKTYTDTVSDS